MRPAATSAALLIAARQQQHAAASAVAAGPFFARGGGGGGGGPSQQLLAPPCCCAASAVVAPWPAQLRHAAARHQHRHHHHDHDQQRRVMFSLSGALKSLQRRDQRYPKERLAGAGVVSPERAVPPHIVRPPYARSAEEQQAAAAGSSSSSSSGGAAAAAAGQAANGGPGLGNRPEVHGAEGAAAMRRVGALAAEALRLAGRMVAPGVTTDAIDAAVHDFLISRGAYPSPLRYCGFPKSVCTSVNEVVCHGIPDDRPLRDGDIVNVDVTAFLGGYHGDTNATFFAGAAPSAAAVELVDVTREALRAAIGACGPGVPFREIGARIHALADAAGLSVVRDFIGHGIGTVFHAAPAVLHHRNLRVGGMALGQTFTIEPILTLGGHRHRGWPDGWTRVTADGSLTAQFEHTLLITEDGAEVLTRVPEEGGGGANRVNTGRSPRAPLRV